MMYAELQSCIDRIKYKPDWKFALHRDPYGSEIFLRVWHLSPDARGGSGSHAIKIMSERRIDGMLTNFSDFKHFVYKLVEGLELHELNEWYKIDGVHYKDPHPELKNEHAEIR